MRFALVVAMTVQLCGAEPPPSVQLVPEFSVEQFQNPDAVFWPAYFWLWNAPLDPDVLRAQLQDMAAHDARSVCMLPMPHGFRPDSTNNSLDPDYLTPEYFERVKLAVDEAARLGMNWWLYDEGGWPSGQALGKVVDGHPELRRRTVTRELVQPTQPYTVPADALALVVESPERTVVMPGETWTPASTEHDAYVYRATNGGPVDLLNSDATKRFIELTHDAYAKVVGDHFGKTIRFTFTDEPGAGMPRPPDNFPWFNGINERYAPLAGHDIYGDFGKFMVEPTASLDRETAFARVNLYDAVTQQYSEAYFGELTAWARARGLATSGHLGGEDEVLGAIKHSFGHVLRQLRREDVPGVDLIWRQLFPGRDAQSDFPIAAASAAHQNGTRFAFTESFCVYGNGLTPAQMKWLTDYQYIRGINMMVIGCYPLSAEDHHMTGERPHFGPMNPHWHQLRGYHAYTARLGYALSVGKPAVRTALYYPARDMWAYGLEAKDAVETFEAIGHELMARQVPFDWIDDDVLAAARVEDGVLLAGSMRYDTILIGTVKWMHPDAKNVLHSFLENRGKVFETSLSLSPDPKSNLGSIIRYGVCAPDVVAGSAAPLVQLSPASRDIRVAGRVTERERIIAVFNEGNAPYDGRVQIDGTAVTEFDALTGSVTALPVADKSIALALEAGESRVFVVSDAPPAAAPIAAVRGDVVEVAPERIVAVAGKQTRVGERNFEYVPRAVENVPFAQSAAWKTWLGENYSGEVDYQFSVTIPESWGTSPVQLETGLIEYAASVAVDGAHAGYLLWAPWRVTLPALAPGEHAITIRVANTLANELTSERVTQAWAKKSGPGWPSPYHERALVFERESRGGGIAGPIRLSKMVSP